MNLATKIILSILCVLILFMGGFTYLITEWQRSAFGKSAHRYTKILGETKGAGLGLAIVEKIVQEHNGKASIFSEAGAGTTVEVSLPTRPPSADKEAGGKTSSI